MAEILGTGSQIAELALRSHRAGVCGKVFVRMDEVEHQHDLVTVKLRAQQVDKKDLTTSDPFLKVARVLETGEAVYVFKTEVQSRTLNPQWKTIQV